MTKGPARAEVAIVRSRSAKCRSASSKCAESLKFYAVTALWRKPQKNWPEPKGSGPNPPKGGWRRHRSNATAPVGGSMRARMLHCKVEKRRVLHSRRSLSSLFFYVQLLSLVQPL